MRFFTRLGRTLLWAVLLAACRENSSAENSSAIQATPAGLLQRRALLIGIDDYSASAVKPRREWQPLTDRAISTLRGPARDVDLLSEMLVSRYGFDKAGIVTLKNQQATHDAILSAIKNHLVAPAKKNDILLLYYAGHGSQVENSLSSELDRKDESIVPADSRLGAPDIRDKTLAVLFNRILDKQARLTLIFDSCHSGSITRALDPDDAVRSVAADPRDVRDASEPPLPESRGALVLTASKDFARAFETEDEKGQPHGLFSWALLTAMRYAANGEAATDTFLRAQAIMRASPPYQDPVMSGDATARLSPLLSDENGKSADSAIAIEKIESDDSIILQGGWAHGLEPGMQLRVRDSGDAAVRVRITEMLGLGRSRARLDNRTRGASAPPALVPGSLLELASWATLPSRPLRVWIPRTNDVGQARTLALKLREYAPAKHVRWIDDPTQTTPTHILRWRDDAWELRTPERNAVRIPSSESAQSILSRVKGEDASLFVQLPAPAALVDGLGVGPGTDYDNVKPLQKPSGADYVLVGHLSGSTIAYAWVRPGVLKEDEANTPLPARTEWTLAEEPISDVAIVMRHAILRLFKILAWHDLQSPPDSPSPYKLKLRDLNGGDIQDARVIGGRKYQLVLQMIDGVSPRELRYYYVFGMDSFGKSVLLFPRRGSVENRFPVNPDAPRVREIPVGQVNVTAPYGQDTYVLLSSDESLPNPSVLEWSGVRTRGPRGETNLEDLLSRIGGATRGQAAPDLPSIWSIDRLAIQSVGPDSEVSP